MPYLESVQELLDAKEGEYIQFKEARNRFSFEDAETIAKEFVFEARKDKSGDRFLHIAFV